MTAGLAMMIALVLLSILAFEQPFAGITRVEPDAFDQLADIFASGANPELVGPSSGPYADIDGFTTDIVEGRGLPPCGHSVTARHYSERIGSRND
jgi:hypothetical protein